MNDVLLLAAICFEAVCLVAIVYFNRKAAKLWKEAERNWVSAEANWRRAEESWNRIAKVTARIRDAGEGDS